ncbi:GAF domain-containing protein [Longimicrobium sp.]|uniref:GAF domain-containing protein n=1 Tax=Longimicrobium sp. TaxID=2029185 RepID=UPI003B3AA1B9
MPYESLPVVRSVRNVLRKASSSDEAITGVLEAVGDSMGWLVGAYWAPEEGTDDGTLVSRCMWAARIHKGTVFASETGQMRLAHGEGLPGRVWTTGESLWIEDVGQDPNFPRHAAARTDGLHAAVAFPVRHGDRVLGVLEFFTDLLRAPVQTLLPVFDQIGGDVGRFVAGMWDVAPDDEAAEPAEADPAGN